MAMRRRSRASSKRATAQSRKAKTLKAVRHSSSSASGHFIIIATTANRRAGRSLVEMIVFSPRKV
jgi:hypothetical protein